MRTLSAAAMSRALIVKINNTDPCLEMPERDTGLTRAAPVYPQVNLDLPIGEQPLQTRADGPYMARKQRQRAQQPPDALARQPPVPADVEGVVVAPQVLALAPAPPQSNTGASSSSAGPP